jgi:hypothetical protein
MGGWQKSAQPKEKAARIGAALICHVLWFNLGGL